MRHNIYVVLENYLTKQKEKNLSERTISDTKERLNFFFNWIASRVKDIREIKKEDIEAYLDYLQSYRKRNGKPLSMNRKLNLIRSLIFFFKFLEKERYIFLNPAQDIKIPFKEETLPKDILSESEVVLLLKAADLKLPEGLRDRAMLEILYGSGLRNTEIRILKLSDIDIENRYIYVRGKGAKDRVVPMTRQSKRYLKEYLARVRPVFTLRNPEENTLFVTRTGKPLTLNRLTASVHRYGKLAGLTKKVTPHSLRHSCAVHLLSRGASIRYVQELLGHSKIDTTQIYTYVMPVSLKEVYMATHPRCCSKVKNF